jgi:hypothetical protein
MGEMLWLENLKGRGRVKDLGVDGMIILGCISGEQVEGCGLNAPGSG